MKAKETLEWAEIADGREIRIAVDTEYQNAETLTIQFATKINGEVRVQLYHAPSLRLYHAPSLRKPHLGTIGNDMGKRFNHPVRVLAAKLITPTLSPAQVLIDLLELPQAQTEIAGRSKDPDRSKTRVEKPHRIRILLVAHFIRVDLLRAFGEKFFSQLLTPEEAEPSVMVRDGRVLGFQGKRLSERYSPPVIETVTYQGEQFEIELGTMDTNCVCGPAKLDELAKSFLGVGKDESICETEKSNMKDTFLNPKKSHAAYRYAIQDSVATLLVAERMTEQHLKLYNKFQIPNEAIPSMHGTPGLRMATLLFNIVRHRHAKGSKQLGAKQSTDPATLKKLRDLARQGSAGALADRQVTEYGMQTGDTHGGLLYSRTPITFFHEGPGQFRDVDLKSCYPTIIQNMNLYLGRPIVLEPGNSPYSLRKAVELMDLHAAGDDAWFIKVSGPIEGFANTLIPSTLDAITNDNFRSRAARKHSREFMNEKWREQGRDNDKDRKYTALFTDEVNAGIVTRATWLIIQTFPPSARKQYEQLRAESIVFYPRKFVANSGAEFDQLTEQFRKKSHSVPWKQSLDLQQTMMLRKEMDIDERYVSLRVPIGTVAKELIRFREEAGPDTAEGQLYKTLANTVYGVFASPFLPTSNPVAGNIITATARAAAYAMTQATNALLVITDGVLYRKDRVPADTFAKRLKNNPDYPLLHATEGPFLDVNNQPDENLSDWYVEHALRFFGVEGKEEYRSLFGLHKLVCKPLPKNGISFDGVFVDGSANYAKLLQSGTGEWTIAEFKARSFHRKQKSILKHLLLKIYMEDRYLAPLSPLSSGTFLNFEEALFQARRTLAEFPSQKVIVPLGFHHPLLATYKLIKFSAFVFRTPDQRKRILVDWQRLLIKTQCGPELLALRRSFKNRLTEVATKIYKLIRSGKERLNDLNIDKSWSKVSVGAKHGEQLREQRKQVLEEWIHQLAQHSESGESSTGLLVDRNSLNQLRQVITQM